ncbi:MAG: ATP-binding protein, partial [Oscillospiraceae bacterium]|nr:ATP-binding protein [Oscillospiraceae bacterium]
EQTDYEKQYQFALELTNDIILKNYLYHLTENEICPIDDNKIDLNDIRIFKITEMVYQNQEYSTYKLASVFSSVQNLECSIAVIIDSDGKKTEFYMGIRTDDKKFDAESLKNILKGALSGQFPGVQTKDLSGTEKEYLLNSISSDNIAAVSCVANNKNENFTSNENFIQGLEKLALAMQGKKYTTVILAKSIPPEELQKTRKGYESTYTQLSFMANRQISYGYNHSENLSSSVQVSESTGSNFAVNIAKQHGESITESHAVSVPDQNAVRKKGIAGSVASLFGMGVAAAFPTGGVSIAAAGVLGALNTAVAMIPVPTETDSTSHTVNDSITRGITEGINRNDTVSATSSEGKSAGNNEGVQFTVQNKSVLNMMERIDKHLKRIDECESLGMWESAAYFFSDSPVIAEMAAGTYKALIAGENSGVQTAALNLWGESAKKKRSVLHQYITNLIHPSFQYPKLKKPVSAGAIVSSNELAIQMGLPRKSVCGFSVIEHAEFGREVIRKIHDEEDAYTDEEVIKVINPDGSFTLKVQESEETLKKKAEKAKRNRSVSVGKIHSMGECIDSDVSLS